MFLKILFRNFRDCFVVQLSKFVTARLKHFIHFIKPEEVCQQLFSFIFKFLSDPMESVLFRVVLADSLIMIPLPFQIVNSFFDNFKNLFNFLLKHIHKACNLC